MSNEIELLLKAIGAYGDAYDRLERLQHSSDLMPAGDQKTGCIGEFYSRIYLLRTRPGVQLRFGGHSEKGWDIECRDQSGQRRVQVKTVSAYSRTRVLSPVHHGWDELHVHYVGRDFRPIAFWIVEGCFVAEGTPQKGLRCPDPTSAGITGSGAIDFGADRVVELKEAIATAHVF